MKIAIDLDGTIVTCRERQMSLLMALAKAHSVEIDADRVWYLKRNGLNNQKSLLACNISSLKVNLICKKWESLIETFPWLYFDKLIDGVVDALLDCRSDGNTLHLLSARSNPSYGFLQLKTLGIQILFDSIHFVSPNIPHAKVLVLKKLSPKYYIGDTERDYDDALMSNTIPILVSTGMRNVDYLYSKSGMLAYSNLFSFFASIHKVLKPIP